MNEMKQSAPSVVAVHDLSCVGRCALTVVIPTLAAMGVQPIPLPTAVLSTHTGGYDGIATRDLTDFMPECLAHWRRLGMRFDAVYSGYLASADQVETVLDLIDWQRREGRPLVAVDPVMGDEGELYSGIDRDMPRRMHALCEQADLITPNMTEAALLLEEPYSLRERTPAEVQEMLEGLPGRCVVITSIPVKGVGWANVCRDGGERGFWLAPYRPVAAHYPGTGDLFATIMVGEMLRGAPAPQAMRRAADFVCGVLKESCAVGGQVRFGVQLEKCLCAWRDGTDEPPVFIRP